MSAAIDYEPTDLVPIDFGAMRSTGIMAIAYKKPKEYLALDSFLHPLRLCVFARGFLSPVLSRQDAKTPSLLTV